MAKAALALRLAPPRFHKIGKMKKNKKGTGEAFLLAKMELESKGAILMGWRFGKVMYDIPPDSEANDKAFLKTVSDVFDADGLTLSVKFI